MELAWNVTSPVTYANGQATFTVANGKTLKIETSPGGDDILIEENTSGKDWRVHISIFVEEVA